MEALNSKKHFPFGKIVKINLKHNARLSITAAVTLCIFTPVVIGTANLDSSSSAMPMEMFVSLIGIVLLTPIFQPEQNADIDDLVSTKYLSPPMIYIIRSFYSVVITAALICLFAIYMGMRDCDVSLLLVLGTFADAVFLGSLGMLTASLSGNTVIGYMIPTVYYALNMGLGSKLGRFYLFSMTIGKYEPKLWLFLAGVLFIAISIFYKKKRKQMM